MRRVVVTGLGLVTPLADGVEPTWKALLEGKSAIRKITKFDASNISCQIAGEINFGEGENEFNAEKYVTKKEQKILYV